jgi:hypothetical protein
MSSLFSDKTIEAEVQILAKVYREINKTTKIKANLIVSGLPAATGGTEDEKKADDKSRVDALVTALAEDPYIVENHKRINTSNNDKPSLIIIEFKDPVHAIQALKGAKNLRSIDKYNGVYVNKDMTQTERIIEKRLRDERKRLNAEFTEVDAGGLTRGRHQGKLFYWGIRDGESGMVNPGW